jgi:hypothetical protein
MTDAGTSATRLDSWQRVEVENEAHFRELNEWTRAAHEEAGIEHIWETYLCECGDVNCSEPITLTRAEYEVVRGHPAHFALATNHENPELDLVLIEHERYTIVEKWFREAARIACATDPRR